jgi:DNA-binding NarL/FixJ family response regulator
MRVIVVDDDAVVASSLAIVLGAQEDIEVVGTGTAGEDAVRLFDELAPDVALLDIQMPGVSGLDAAERILAKHPEGRIVFLTTFSDDEYIVRALHQGARGYLIKQDVATIAPALRSVMRGQCVLEGEVLSRAVSLGNNASAGSPGAGANGSGDTDAGAVGGAAGGAAGDDVGGTAAGAGANPGAPAPDLAAMFPQLTDREREVVKLVAEGLDNREIAQAACMGEGTVRNHISDILAKLGLANRTQIAVAYYRALR